MLLFDADILIDVLRGHAPAVEWLAGLREVPSVPGLVIMELIQDAENQERVEKALKLVRPLRVVWPTAGDCDRALSWLTAFHLSSGLGVLDSLIAACATGLSATLCSFNAKHYRVVPGLIIEQPYARRPNLRPEDTTPKHPPSRGSRRS